MYDKWQSLVVVQKGEVTSSPPCDKPNIFGGYWNDDKDAAIISDKIMLLLGRDFEETNTLLSTEDVTRLKAGGWEPLLSSLQGRGRNVRRRKRGRPSKGKDEEEGEEDDKQEEDYSDRGSLDGLGGKRPYRGVSLNCFTRKWRANFVVNDVEVRLYHGDDEEAAARAYDSAAFHLFGKEAGLNFEYKDRPPKPNLTIQARLDAMDVLEPRNQEAEPEGEDEEEEGEEEEVDERGGIHEKVRSFPSYEQPRTLNDELKAKADSKIDEEKRESAPPVALRLKGELRLKTRRLKYQGLTSKHVGVHVSKGRWRANIWWKMKSIHLGYCATEAEAGRLYDSAAYYLRGAEAQPNFPDEQPRPLSDELKAKIDAVKRLEKSSVDDGNGKVEEIEQESDDEKDQSKKKGRSKVPRSNAAPTSVAIDSRLLQARQGPAIPAASSVEEMGYERFTSAIDQWVDMLRP